ncbi:MAG: ABC transporter ATP-binding protein/permease [Leptospiraceae bacterium]|nr:ABC transporter ATP-binding protein/permease [Leptospiraceae bacterium]MDW7975455.1 ABC transporter ATP-binding protein [Leptospiraceae bacterium]
MIKVKNLSWIFKFLWRYKFRFLLGMIFALIAAFANLFSLSSFVPIFNTLDSEKPVQVIEIGPEERKIYEKSQQQASLKIYERLYSYWVELKLTINSYFEGKTNKEIIFTIILFILPVYVLKIFSLILSTFLFGTGGFYAMRDLRNLVMDKLNCLNVSYYEQERMGYILSRVVNDIHLISRTIAVEFQEMVVNFFYIITHVALLILISWKMFFFIVIGIPILMIPINKFAVKVKKAAKSQQERLADLLSHINEVISGIRVIRAFSMEKFEEMRFNLINEKLYKDNYRGHFYHQVGPAISEMVITLIVLSFLIWGAYEIVQDNITKGHFFAFFFTLLFVMRPVIQISVVVNVMGILDAAAERIREIIDSKDEFEVSQTNIPFEGLKEGIEFREVSFRYPQRDNFALKNINLKIPKNQVVALVGESGSGKSTLIDLLFRFYEPTKGDILVDQRNLKDYEIASWRRKIGIVPQNVFLFHATILENITLFRTDIPFEKVIKACKIAHIHDFIETLPQGYHTLVGERGVMLSGGQRQRIAIARALVVDPEILILDEATSALDNENEKLIQMALEDAIKEKTVIIVAHRLRTVYKADIIYVLQEGSIVEVGNHQELLQKNGVYRNLYELQFHS